MLVSPVHQALQFHYNALSFLLFYKKIIYFDSRASHLFEIKFDELGNASEC